MSPPLPMEPGQDAVAREVSQGAVLLESGPGEACIREGRPDIALVRREGVRRRTTLHVQVVQPGLQYTGGSEEGGRAHVSFSGWLGGGLERSIGLGGGRDPSHGAGMGVHGRSRGRIPDAGFPRTGGVLDDP